jgi:uncharacterized membrane protein
MFQYESFHLIVSAIFSFVAIFGGIYVFRTLKMLYSTPEVLESQRPIWVPILVGGGFFTVSGIFHLIEHFIPSGPELDLVSEFFLLVGLSLLALSIFRYWRLQREYNEIKHGALRKVQSP